MEVTNNLSLRSDVLRRLYIASSLIIYKICA
jgi:hypothetical protein